MPLPVSTIPNLGPASEEQFARAGITSAEELRDMGADEAYRRWLQAGLPAHFIGYYALVMGLQGRPWNDCRGEEKDRLRLRFDALKAESRSSAAGISREFEAALETLGVVRAENIRDRP